MSFIEERFPETISYGSSGGPSYLTTVVETKSGLDSRNAERSQPKHSYNAAHAVQTLDELAVVLRFFHAMQGQAYGFRWKDWADFKSCLPSETVAADDQAIGTGDGATTTFQLVKKYTVGSQTLSRTIKKPVSGTVKVAVAGVEKTITTHFTVNTTTGIITFTAGNIPTAGQAITAGYEFDVPVRFKADDVVLTHEAYLNGVLDIPLVEDRTA